MAHVLCLQPEEYRHLELKRVLGRPADGLRHRVESVTGWSGLMVRCRVPPSPVLVAVVDPYVPTSGRRPDGLQAEPLGRLRDRFPSVGVVACFEVRPGRIRDVVRLVEIGVREVVDWSEEDAPSRLRRAVARAASGRGDCLREALRARYAARASWPAVDYVFAEPRPGLTVRGLARAHSTSARSLQRRLREDGLGTPHRLIALGLLYHASVLLADPGRSVEAVGRALGFSDCSAICKSCRRHLSLTPTSLRRGIDAEAWCRLLEREATSGGRGSRPEDRLQG